MKEKQYQHNLKISKRLETVLEQLESVEIFDKTHRKINRGHGNPMEIGANDLKDIPPKVDGE